MWSAAVARALLSNLQDEEAEGRVQGYLLLFLGSPEDVCNGVLLWNEQSLAAADLGLPPSLTMYQLCELRQAVSPPRPSSLPHLKKGSVT